MSYILVVEDEEPIAEILKFSLEHAGYTVRLALDGLEAIHAFHESEPMLVLLDLMLPERDGFEVCKEIRLTSTVPIIMLTARESEIDKVLGLELGADDYVTKPFGTRELLARVKANIRRAYPDEGVLHVDDKSRIVLRDLVVDLRQYQAQRKGVIITLTHREFELLTFLVARPGTVYTRDQLLQEVWGINYDGDARTVDVTVRRLREKLEDDPSNPDYVMTKRGVGYYVRR